MHLDALRTSKRAKTHCQFYRVHVVYIENVLCVLVSGNLITIARRVGVPVMKNIRHSTGVNRK
jgi:hypothetical protein